MDYIVDNCMLCKVEINLENCGEDCNFCNKSICETCYDKEPANEVMMYGYVCKECKI